MRIIKAERTTLLGFIIIAGILILTGCGKDEVKTDILIGHWIADPGVPIVGDSIAVPALGVYFNNDNAGKMILNEGREDETILDFKWTLLDDALIISDASGTDTAAYQIDGDNLTMELGGTKINLKRDKAVVY